MAKLDAVSVVEMLNDELLSVNCFSDDDEGYKEAIEFFKNKANERGITETDNNYCESGTYQMWITMLNI